MFQGFPRAGLDFLANLGKNNNRAWFEANREVYQSAVLEPAQALVQALGERLREIVPHIRFDARASGGSLMRINRDVRFSKDKAPYHDYISALLWEGAGKKNECPAFGFRLTADGMDLMAGQFMFQPTSLHAFRAAVLDDRTGRELPPILDDLRSRPGYVVGGEELKNVPRGFDAGHPRADLLRYKGLFAHPPRLEGPVINSPDLVDACMAQFVVMAPLQQWLVRATQ